MKIRAAILFIVAIFAMGTPYAQDVIVKKDGEVIPARVEKVLPEQIEYRKESNPEGPLYVVRRCEIREIRYKNGTMDQFSETCERKRFRKGSGSRYFVSLESRVGIFGLFNISDTGLTTSLFSVGGTPSFMMRVSNIASIGLECMFLWGQAKTDDPIRFILNPNIRTQLQFPLNPKITLELITAGGLSIWPVHDYQAELHETFFDQRTGWNARVAFGMEYALNDRLSLLANSGYSANSSVSEEVWITHDMMTIDIGVRYHFGRISFEKK